MNKYSIIVPIYNEEKNIELFLSEFKNFLENKINQEIEIVIVNDGSNDQTKNLIMKWFENNLNVKNKIIHSISNFGYGASLKIGINNSSYDNIIIIDCDQTYKFSDINRLQIEYETNNLDMIVGSRINTLKKENFYYFKPKNLAREFIRRFSCFMIKKNIIDINSGLRIFHKNKFKQIEDFLPNGFSFTSSITCLFFQKNFSVRYIDIDYLNRGGESKIKPVKDFLNFINLIVKMTIMIKPLRIFIPLFFLTFSLSLFLLIIRAFFSENFFGTGITLLIVSLLFLFFGYVFEMLLIIFNKIKK
tara:strand:- start:679 stop:1587 length:909 start_codon:yes stop_codon:yes gene_type:complete